MVPLDKIRAAPFRVLPVASNFCHSDSLLQFDVPVHLADELLPTWDHPRVVEPRIPLRLDWLLAKLHSSLRRCPVRLPEVAVDAGQHAVLPRALTPTTSRHYVVHSQAIATRLLAAILANVLVSVEQVSPAERDRPRRHTGVIAQSDYLWQLDPASDTLNVLITLGGRDGHPVLPRELRIIVRIDDLGRLAPHHA